MILVKHARHQLATININVYAGDTYPSAKSQRLDREISGGKRGRHRQTLLVNIQFAFAQQRKPCEAHSTLERVRQLLLLDVARNVVEREQQMMLRRDVNRKLDFDLLVPGGRRVVVEHRA